ncbi:hypothetical protein H5T87_05905 [bacterium]|nr:hypothetical protein [bacterium]
MRSEEKRKLSPNLKISLLLIALVIFDKLVLNLVRGMGSVISLPAWMLSVIEGFILSCTLFCIGLSLHRFKRYPAREIWLFSIIVFFTIIVFPPIIFKMMVYLSPSGQKLPTALLEYGILLQPYLVYFLSCGLASLILKWSVIQRRWLYAGLLGFGSFFYFSLCDVIPIIKDFDLTSFFIVIFYSLSTSLGGMLGGFIADNMAERRRVGNER